MPTGAARLAPPVLIVNPASFAASRGLAAPVVECARAGGAEVVPVDDPAALEAALTAILAREQRHVAVLAGDGTAQAVVDRLARLAPGAWKPDLLILPGGRSNLTANDLLPGAGAVRALGQALELAHSGRWDAAVVERAVLRVAQPPAPPRHGFFVAGALVDAAIRRVHAERKAKPPAFDAALASTVLSLLRLGASALAGRSGISCPDLDVDAGALGRVAGPVRLLLLTTLRHERGAFDPYAPRGAGDLRVTAVTHRARAFWLRLPGLVTGRYSAAMDPAGGYLSGRCDRVVVTGLRTCMLDGEPVDLDPARPTEISAGPRLRFLVPHAS